MAAIKTCLASWVTLGLGILLCAQIATQWFAYRCGYQPILGTPLCTWYNIPIYLPWQFFIWRGNYFQLAPLLFTQIANWFFCASGSVLILAVCVHLIQHRQNRSTDTFGSARWASWAEIKAAKLASHYGVVLGLIPNWASRLQALLELLARLQPWLKPLWVKLALRITPQVKWLKHDGPEHILVNAPSRSGKGVAIIIPTLLSWGHSVVVMDIKGENWALTSGFRAKFSHALYFSPTSELSAKWNPLSEVRQGVHEVRDVQNIADILVDPDGSSKTRSHWEKTGHSLLVASILHVLYAEQDKTLAGVANFLSNPDCSIVTTLKMMMATPHRDGLPHPVISSCAREMLNKSDNELSGVLSTAMSFLGLYRDPIVAQNTAACDFHLDDIMNAERPISLYLVVPPSDISRLSPLNRMMINMMLRRLTEVEIGAGGSPHRHRCLFLLDEFPSLGCMDFFKTSLGFVAGYGIKCMLITQSFNNIYEHYGMKNSIFDNCHIRAVMAPNDNETAKEISIGLGQRTARRLQTNFTGRRLAVWLGNVSVATQENGRALLTDDEVKRLDKSKLILMVAQSYPILAQKVFYYSNLFYQTRLLPEVILKPSDHVDKPPTRRCKWQGTLPVASKQQDAGSKPKKNMNNTDCFVSEADSFFQIEESDDKQASPLLGEISENIYS